MPRSAQWPGPALRIGETRPHNLGPLRRLVTGQLLTGAITLSNRSITRRIGPRSLPEFCQLSGEGSGAVLTRRPGAREAIGERARLARCAYTWDQITPAWS